MVKSATRGKSTLGGACKEPPPAPGNRSNERRYKEKGSGKDRGEKVVERGEERGDEESGGSGCLFVNSIMPMQHGCTLDSRRRQDFREVGGREREAEDPDHPRMFSLEI
ncbi:hypothetical protein TNCV_334931 [Trichonephila clavipes]|nr:hypothetical protein TNCV_334931 [Trichonephila clavipes]